MNIKNWYKILITAFNLFLVSTLFAQQPDFLNQGLDFDKRVSDLISRLTLKQKAQLLNHAGTTVVVDGFSIRADLRNQCLHGVAWTEPATVFPSSIAFGATWNPALVQRVATVIADEARAIYNGWKMDPNFKGEHKGLIYRSPVINISRNPYWGRISEIFGEDPYHTGRIGVAYVKGLQGDDPKYLKLASTLKHYAVNNVEINRQKLSVDVPERMLFEYWLPHFRDCIVEGKAQSVMASYNAINGTPNNVNHFLLTGILKERWRHEGFVVSDAGGVRTMVEGHEKGLMSYPEAVGKSLMAGCDFSDPEFEQYIPDALYNGYMTEERLNDALRRVLTVRMKLGEFDDFHSVPYSKISPDTIMAKEHRKLTLLTAEESIVLLKNNGILPLDKNKLKRVAVIGPYADLFNQEQYYGGIPVDPVKPLQGIINKLGDNVEVIYEKGGEIFFPLVRKGFIPPFVDREAEIKKAVEAAKKSDIAILFIGTTVRVEMEGMDRETLNLSGNQQQLLDAVMAANKNTIVVLMSAGPLTIPSAKKNAAAILQGWWPGEEGGTAIANVLFGDYNPAGRLPYTMYESDAQVPPVNVYDISAGFTYMYLKGKPQYAFGHGLSYSKFNYSNLRLSNKDVTANDIIRIEVDIKNTGKMTGDEVVQLYVKDLNTGYIHPERELRGFKRISIPAGEVKKVNLELPISSLAYYDTATGDFKVIPGKYEIMIGSASDDIRLKSTITLK